MSNSAKGRPTSSVISERIKTSPNAKLCQYLDTWYHQAAARNDRLQFVYRRALLSLLEVNNPIDKFSDLEKIKGIGPNIRSRLERCYTEEFGPLPNNTATATSSSVNTVTTAPAVGTTLLQTPAHQQQPTSSGEQQLVNRSTAKRSKEYIPMYRSGPYAMLIALYLESLRVQPVGYLTRAEIIKIGQQYCNAPLEEGQFSAINGAIKTLLTKSLILKGVGSGSKTRFSLTDEGTGLAERLWSSGERRSSIPLPEIPENESYTFADNNVDEVVCDELNDSQSHSLVKLRSGEYDIILFIDNREVKSSAGQEHRNYIVEKLKSFNVKCEQRSLELGDFLWVARSKSDSVADEIVLDLIVERKREDDLVASITDGRFKEQKFRLRNSGISRIVYLIERIEHLDYGNVGKERFETAVIQTHSIDGMTVKFTQNLDDTIKFIYSLTLILQEEYSTKDLTALFMPPLINKSLYISKIADFSLHHGHPIYQTYGCFCQINSKSANLTIRDVFAKQLLTIRGITPEKALQITEHFPSAMALWRQYQSMSSEGAPLYFSTWKTEDGKKYGPALSRKIFNLFCATNYDTNIDTNNTRIQL